MSRLIDECRRNEAVAEVVHDAPTRQCPAAAEEPLERAGCDNMLIDLRSLDEPDACAIADEVDALDRDLPALLSEPEVEEATVTLMYAPVTKTGPAPAAALAQRSATIARRGRVGPLLRLGALVVLGLGLLVVLRLGPWQVLGN